MKAKVASFDKATPKEVERVTEGDGSGKGVRRVEEKVSEGGKKESVRVEGGKAMKGRVEEVVEGSKKVIEGEKIEGMSVVVGGMKGVGEGEKKMRLGTHVGGLTAAKESEGVGGPKIVKVGEVPVRLVVGKGKDVQRVQVRKGNNIWNN